MGGLVRDVLCDANQITIQYNYNYNTTNQITAYEGESCV